jgi:P4 family phage/plasmid primase-like protien
MGKHVTKTRTRTVVQAKNDHPDIEEDEDLTFEQTLVKDATESSVGVAALMEFVANGRIKFDTSRMWIFNDGIWSHYKGSMEKIQIKRFMNKEVLPFARLHCPDSVSLKSVMKMNSNSALDDFKAADSVLCLDFIDRVDQDPDYLCFTDGFYNLATKEFTPFDDSTSSLYFSKHVGYEFPHTKGEHYDNVVKFFEQTHPNAEKRKFFLNSIANALNGQCRNSKIMFWQGSGGNGKTVTAALISETWGDYAVDLPSGYLQRISSSTGPDPMTLELRGKRMVISSEPPNGKKVQADTVKRMTGGDTARARDLYASGNLESFILNLQLNVLCNRLPPIDGDDGGIERRVKVITFEAKFDACKSDGVDISDDSIAKKMHQWKSDFMWMLLNEYYDPEWDGQAPESIVQVTKRYLDTEGAFSDL